MAHSIGMTGMDPQSGAALNEAHKAGKASDIGAYSLNSAAAPRGKFMVSAIDAPANTPLANIAYAYHFDAGLYARYLRRYAEKLEGTGVRLLDTRKTMPGLRYPDKYAVLCGGGHNHRRNLAEMLMLKDNHIDAAGSMTKAVELLRGRYNPCPPIEVECRNHDEISEAVACRVDRIMLDNMTPDMLPEALEMIPSSIETEISGGVSLDTIRAYATVSTVRKPDFISVGRITHSAVTADLSMRIAKESL